MPTGCGVGDGLRCGVVIAAHVTGVVGGVHPDHVQAEVVGLRVVRGEHCSPQKRRVDHLL